MNTPSKYLQIDRVAQTFRTAKGDFPALRDIHLNVAKGEFVALIGHSGCGKSTLLNLIAGLTRPSEGTLLCANKEIVGPGPERAMVFQNHSLLPWLTCYDNVYLGVERVFGNHARVDGRDKESKAQLKERTDAALALVGLTHASHKRPGEISGGMKQRVGIARAVMQSPALLLADEPTSSLDPKSSVEIMALLQRIGQERAIPVIVNMHDVELAKRFADRIVGMSQGRVVFDGPPAELTDTQLTAIYGGTSWLN